jgi:hypothetical protein
MLCEDGHLLWGFRKQEGKETAYAAGNFELAISAFSLTIKITQENFIRKNLPWGSH